VGERAVALLCLRDGVFWYRSQWAGSEAVLADVFDAESPLSALAEADWTLLRRTDDSCLSRLDALTVDVVYLVSTAGVAVFCPLWFGLGYSRSPRPDAGVFVPVDSRADLLACRVALRQVKGCVLDAIKEGHLAPARARGLLWRCSRLVGAVAGP